MKMEKVAFGEILQWTEAHLVGILNDHQQVVGLSTDSRTLAEGELFLALTGDRFDGHDYVEDAFARGASAALVERSFERRVAGPLLKVDSTLRALGHMARHYRRRFAVPVVGLTGSSGKTTTKEMISAVLGRRYRVLKTEGSENNEIGVPRTLLQLTRDHEAVVLELAARRAGDIRYLCSIAGPTLGVLLNIGSAHLEFFGSVEGVAKAKGELLDYLDESFTALVNADDRVVAQEAKRTKGRLLSFGFEREGQFRGEGLVLDQEGCGHFLLQTYPIDLQIPGRHNAYNALAAAAVGRILDVPWADIQAALSAFRPVALRSQVLRKKGICIINDCYNANPGSTQAALELLAAMGPPGARRVAVLGDMLELGERSAELHAETGRRAAAAATALVAIGPQSVHLAEAARQAGMKAVQHFADSAAAAAFVRGFLQEGDVVLFKASRGMRLDTLVEEVSR